jgi:hypothetical protein
LSYKEKIWLESGGYKMNNRMGKQNGHPVQKVKSSGSEEVHGDKVGGDIISVGSISSSQGVAIGRGAQVRIQSGVGAKELAELFSPIYQKIEARPPDPMVEKEEIADRVKRIEKEVNTGENAQPTKVERWLKDLAAMAPDILDVTLGALTSPIAGISIAIQKIAQKIRQEMHGAT